MTPGIQSMTMAEYIALPALSSGICHTLLSESPLHAWTDSPFNPNRERDESKIADIGTVMHELLLGGDGNIVVIDPENYVGKTGEAPKGWTNAAIRDARDTAYLAGKTPILLAAYQEAAAAVKVTKDYIASSELAGIFDTGAAEQTIIWKDGETLCKARPDWLNADVCLHLKTTTRSVNPSAFERMAINMGYDVSLAFYARGIKRDRHLILAIEQEPPYACKLFGLSAAQEDISARKVERAINAWAACMKAGKFPAYSGEVHYIEPAPWDMAKAEQAMQEDEFAESAKTEGIPL